MSDEVFLKYESNVRSYCRKWPVVFTKAKGSKIWDSNNKEYLDFFNGAGALNYGHNPSYITEKVIEYIASDGIIHSLDMYAGAKSEFITTLQEKILKPRGLKYKVMFPGPTGTNAVEAAIKLARKVTGRSSVFSLMGAFHGMTLGALALTTDKASRKGSGVNLSNVEHIPAPYYLNNTFDTIGYLEEILTDDHSGIDTPAAIIIETVQAEGGVYVLDDKFLRDLREFCTKHDILLIVDDIQVGCGRTGYFFSFERAGIVPDIVVLSKSIGGCGMPLSVVLLKDRLDVFNPGEHNGTFRGFQLSMVSGKAGIEMFINEDVASQVKKKEKIVESFLKKEIKPLLKNNQEYRGIGLIWGIDFKDGKLARKALDYCFANNLIIELAGRGDSVLKIMPSLVISEEELKQGLEIIKKAVMSVNK